MADTTFQKLEKVWYCKDKIYHAEIKAIHYDDFLEICDDIFVIVGAENSEIFSLIINNKEVDAIELIKSYKTDFNDNFIIEIQNSS